MLNGYQKRAREKKRKKRMEYEREREGGRKTINQAFDAVRLSLSGLGSTTRLALAQRNAAMP